MTKNILHMISPQENVSPFDVNMACDAGYDLVIPYTNVNLTDVKALCKTQSFLRSVSNAKKTGIFMWKRRISCFGHDGCCKNAMVPPFEISVFLIQPARLQQHCYGACTEKTLKQKLIQILKVKTL